MRRSQHSAKAFDRRLSDECDERGLQKRLARFSSKEWGDLEESESAIAMVLSLWRKPCQGCQLDAQPIVFDKNN